LQSMPTPADYDLHGLSQHYMSAAGSWWRGDDEKKLFGDERAENNWLPIELKDGLSGNLQSFLSDHFSKALLVRSLANNDNYKDKFSDDDRDKLTYWWQGKVRLVNHINGFRGFLPHITDLASVPSLYLAIQRIQ
jgi:hypothetical protein